MRKHWSSRMIAATLKERKLCTISHQTVINFLGQYGLNGNHIETSLDGRIKLKVMAGKKLGGLEKTPVFVLGFRNKILDIQLARGDRISTIRAMFYDGRYLEALQALDLALYSLISSYDLEAKRGSASLGSDLSYRLRDYVRGKKRRGMKRLISDFLRGEND